MALPSRNPRGLPGPALAVYRATAQTRQADLLLTVVKDSTATLMLFAFIAGFSERLIPEFLGKLEENQTNDG
ncbi:MAG: hypothetical protein ACFHX7_12400 [Pseudomonadota bacterium]